MPLASKVYNANTCISQVESKRSLSVMHWKIWTTKNAWISLKMCDSPISLFAIFRSIMYLLRTWSESSRHNVVQSSAQRVWKPFEGPNIIQGPFGQCCTAFGSLSWSQVPGYQQTCQLKVRLRWHFLGILGLMEERKLSTAIAMRQIHDIKMLISDRL